MHLYILLRSFSQFSCFVHIVYKQYTYLICQIQAEREKTSGSGWFNMKAPEVTEELKNDLKALKMRSAMDPKRFYKKNDREGFPKYFQVGWGVFISRRFPLTQFFKKLLKKTLCKKKLRIVVLSKYRHCN